MSLDHLILRPADVVRLVIERGAHALYADRVRDMVNRAAISGRGAAALGFDQVRVPPTWPLRGAITLRRTDGVRFALRFFKGRWQTVRLGVV